MRRVFIAVFLVVACATGAAAGPREDADLAFLSGDYALAARLLRPFAEKEDARAQSNLGQLYYRGQGVLQDYQEAMKWFRKAAKQGDEEAQFNLGGMYALGKGVPQDAQEAARWYRRAAEQGDTLAQLQLGLMYNQGQGVPQDFARAHMWYNVAAAASSGFMGRITMNSRDQLALQMTAAQIEKAQEMARRCQQSQFKECD